MKKILLALLALSASSQAYAQAAGQDVIIMRKVVSDPQVIPTPGSGGPGSGTATYDWTVGQWTDPGAACGSEIHTRSVTCTRTGTGAVVEDGLCPAIKPDATLTVADDSGCGAWNAAAFGAWDSACSTSAVRTRSVTCVANGTLVDDSRCKAEDRPETTEVGAATEGCGGVLTNPGFEDSKTGWNDNGVAVHYSPNAVDGHYIVQLQWTGFQAMQTPKHLKDGTRYRATIHAWPVDLNKSSHQLRLQAGGPAGVLGTNFMTRPGSDQGWKQLSVEFTYRSGSYIDVASTDGAWWIDLLQIEPIP